MKTVVAKVDEIVRIRQSAIFLVATKSSWP